MKIYNLPYASLSEARNFAIKKLSNSNIIAFPDDDCKYPNGLLDYVLDFYNKNKDKNCKGICFNFPGRNSNVPQKIYKK